MLLDREGKEKEFLIACGMDLSHGFFSEDVTFWKVKEPELYSYYFG